MSNFIERKGRIFMKVQPAEFLKRSSVIKKIIADGAQMVVDMNTRVITSHQPHTFNEKPIVIAFYSGNNSWDLPVNRLDARAFVEGLIVAGFTNGSFYVRNMQNTRTLFTDANSMRLALTSMYERWG